MFRLAAPRWGEEPGAFPRKSLYLPIEPTRSNTRSVSSATLR